MGIKEEILKLDFVTGLTHGSGHTIGALKKIVITISQDRIESSDQMPKLFDLLRNQYEFDYEVIVTEDLNFKSKIKFEAFENHIEGYSFDFPD